MSIKQDKIETSIYAGIGCFILISISSILALIWALIYIILTH